MTTGIRSGHTKLSEECFQLLLTLIRNGAFFYNAMTQQYSIRLNNREWLHSTSDKVEDVIKLLEEGLVIQEVNR